MNKLLIVLIALAAAVLFIILDKDVTVNVPETVVNVQTPDIIVETEIVIEDGQDGWTEETVLIRMNERKYPWTVYNMTAERYNNRLWIITVEFKEWNRHYIFDERCA